MTELEAYYNKFNEEKRLGTRHGIVEFSTSMRYIHKYLETMEAPKILDIGAGTGRYSVALAEEGYDVTAVELVKYNLGILKQKNSTVKAYQGNALKLKRFADETFDLTLLFGPMYHLHSHEEKLQALLEAKRVTKTGGSILVAYYMNDYCIIKHGFMEGHIKESVEKQVVTEDFQCLKGANELYSMVRLEEINTLNEEAKIMRRQIIAADGAADYMRPVLNAMDEETFQLFLQYHWANCERPELLGASSHTVDILQKLADVTII